MPWIQEHWTLIAWILCEILALIPAVKSNSILTLVYSTLKSMIGSNPPPPLP